MTATISYEIHVMRGGRWVTSGVYQDKSDAMRDARGPMRKRYLGIRVIEEIFDPERERFVTRTLYRDMNKVDPCAPDANPAAARARSAAAVARGDETIRSAGLAFIGLSVVLLMGIGGLFWFGLV